MNKSIKLFLVFALLFGCATHHKQAQAGVVKTAVRTTVGALTLVLGLAIAYWISEAYAYSGDTNDSPDQKEKKKNVMATLEKIDITALKINSSLKRNLSVDINKYREKFANVLKDSGNAIEDAFLTTEAKKEKIERNKKIQAKKEEQKKQKNEEELQETLGQNCTIL